MYVFAQIGVSLPHYAAAQYSLGRSVSKSELQPGDLVFFRGLGHMGMYMGGGDVVHAPRTGDVVKISSLSEGYYVSNCGSALGGCSERSPAGLGAAPASSGR